MISITDGLKKGTGSEPPPKSAAKLRLREVPVPFFKLFRHPPRDDSASRILIALIICASAFGAPARAAVDADALAKSATIHRDDYGTPHIEGPTDESVVFAFAYAQAEDYFWQLEDNYILALGRYSEFHGPLGLNSDLLNRAFEVVSTSETDFPKLSERTRQICEAYAAGLNYFLAHRPDVTPRAITHFEPWHLLALQRQLVIELSYRYTRLSHDFAPRANKQIWAGVGSNAWAVGPSKTNSKKAMLVINPHQPWFGFGQFCEGHLKSGEGWSFTGGAFFGLPFPLLGHNEHVGWAMTTNEPDIADAWRETFDDSSKPLQYRYGNGFRQATEWKSTIKVKEGGRVDERHFTFRKTHHGPIVEKLDDQHYLSVRIGKLYEMDFVAQGIAMMRAKSIDDFRSAMAQRNFPSQNLIYADRQGNIYALYNGIIARRDPQFDWSHPVDGSDPRTEWRDYHPIDELPQTFNPPTGYVQNCNSSPFTTTDEGSPFLGDFPSYMVEDKYDDKRRAKRAREMLREMKSVTFEEMQQHVFDTKMFWASNELPAYQRAWKELEKTNPALAAEVEPYLKHLLDWDCRVTGDSTAATLAAAWYEELYGSGYPNETIKPRFVQKPELRFRALIEAAAKLKSFHGDWRVKWGDIHRIQRHANVAEFIQIPFDDKLPSLPSWGAPTPPGVLFAQMYTPSIKIPFVKTLLKQYGVVGMTYVSVIEFGDKIRAATLLQFGQSGDPKSPHFFDQAKLLSERKLKPEKFYWDDVLAAARRSYHPGEERTGSANIGQ